LGAIFINLIALGSDCQALGIKSQRNLPSEHQAELCASYFPKGVSVPYLPIDVEHISSESYPGHIGKSKRIGDVIRRANPVSGEKDAFPAEWRCGQSAGFSSGVYYTCHPIGNLTCWGLAKILNYYFQVRSLTYGDPGNLVIFNAHIGPELPVLSIGRSDPLSSSVTSGKASGDQSSEQHKSNRPLQWMFFVVGGVCIARGIYCGMFVAPRRGFAWFVAACGIIGFGWVCIAFHDDLLSFSKNASASYGSYCG
jgi:hypothetical protein